MAEPRAITPRGESESVELVAVRSPRRRAMRAVAAPAAWVGDISTELRGAKGWKLVGEILAGCAVLWGLLMGVMTYHSSHLEELRESAERSYYQILRDLGDDSLQVRIGAIQRIPDVMLRQVPVSDTVGPADALRLTLGGRRRTVAMYHRNMQRAIRLHLASLNVQNKKWSLEEVSAVVGLLSLLREPGWYEGTAPADQPEGKESLAWIWRTQRENESGDSVATTLFEKVKLEGIAWQQFRLDSGDFRGADLDGANISYARFSHANLNGASMDAADMSHSDLRFSQFDQATLNGTYLTAALLESSTFKFAVMENSHFQEANCPHCIFLEADLKFANIQQANLENASMQNASLDQAFALGADMSGVDFSFSSLHLTNLSRATLTGAKFNYANATGAKFTYSSVAETQFAFCDLRGADFSHAVGIEQVSDWFDSNIADATGFSKTQRDLLLSKGAVEIANEQSWRAYKEAGRPHKQWRVYGSQVGHRN